MSKTIAGKAAKGKSADKKAVAKAAHSAKASKTSASKPAADKKKTAKSAVKPAPVKSSKEKTATAAKPAVQKPAAPGVAARQAAAPKPASKKSEGTNKKMAPRVKIADIVLPPGYKPSDGEPFMNDMHKAYFRKRLLDWKDEILRQTRETLAILHEDSTQHADLADRATSETDRATELRTRDRQRKLIAKIDAALGRIEDGTYGYCEDTGEPIGLKRLDARPIATLSVEAQERHERRERVYREE
ncbi:TraR/DksA family transcriptional regulator [Hyphomicrobium denitrificans 1NES1]|uniref:RNA polymerase-binding transcription factor DksA n=1 Tax=Hyphomicrobium denitrificans 1NES1 TaxID=670307 RepID=N0BE56_9HYPH|nr:TraR/DksA family transcriptional regulator [Hyphomicrobium denitrificans 1NES1]